MRIVIFLIIAAISFQSFGESRSRVTFKKCGEQIKSALSYAGLLEGEDGFDLLVKPGTVIENGKYSSKPRLDAIDRSGSSTVFNEALIDPTQGLGISTKSFKNKIGSVSIFYDKDENPISILVEPGKAFKADEQVQYNIKLDSSCSLKGVDVHDYDSTLQTRIMSLDENSCQNPNPTLLKSVNSNIFPDDLEHSRFTQWCKEGQGQIVNGYGSRPGFGYCQCISSTRQIHPEELVNYSSLKAGIKQCDGKVVGREVGHFSQKIENLLRIRPSTITTKYSTSLFQLFGASDRIGKKILEDVNNFCWKNKNLFVKKNVSTTVAPITPAESGSPTK